MSLHSRSVLALGLLALAHMPTTASACSCIKVEERPAEVRTWANDVLSNRENVVLVKALSVVSVGDSREQAVLKVVDSWKGTFVVGSIVRSDTADVGGGMCGMSLKEGELYLAIFESEPIEIAGCPVDGGVTKLQRKYLDRLAAERAQESQERARAK